MALAKSSAFPLNHHSKRRYSTVIMLPTSAIRLKWLIFVSLLAAAIVMTCFMAAVGVTSFLFRTETGQSVVNAFDSNRHSLGVVWLPQRSLLPSICIGEVHCRLLIADADVKPTVAVLIVATGKYYTQYVRQLLESSRTFFCRSCTVRYFIFTDSNNTESYLPASHWPDVTHLKQQQLGWPFDSMARFSIYKRFYAHYKPFDFIVSMDADLHFVSPVDRELLGDLVGVLHPGFFGMRGTYEEANTDSTAYVRPFEGTHYFTGGLWAASSHNFLKLVSRLTYAIDEDLRRGIIALWHDESHLNRYFIDHQPTTILSPIYHYPSNRRPSVLMGPDLKIVTFNKSYSELRASTTTRSHN